VQGAAIRGCLNKKAAGLSAAFSCALIRQIIADYGVTAGVTGGVPDSKFNTNNTIKMTKNKKNNILAISVAVDATPRKPNKPATMAITRKTRAQYNMVYSLISY
jgi:hypothetical protein